MIPEQDLEDEIVFEKDEDLKEAEGKIGELLKSKERTPEQEQELTDLRKKRQGRYNERLKELTAARRKAQEQAAKAEAQTEELRQQLKERDSRVEPKISNYEQITINGKKFYTDDALTAMVQDGKMTQSEAWRQQKIAIKEEALEDLKKEQQKETFERNKNAEIEWVLGKYPHFNPQHDNFNPNDPIYKEASRLMSKGMTMRSAVEEAEEKMKGARRPDLSDDLSVTRQGSPAEVSRKSVVAELSEFEKDNAVRLWHMSGKVNPKTNKPYTQQEAIQKAMLAKQERSAALTARR